MHRGKGLLEEERTTEDVPIATWDLGRRILILMRSHLGLPFLNKEGCSFFQDFSFLPLASSNQSALMELPRRPYEGSAQHIQHVQLTCRDRCCLRPCPWTTQRGRRHAAPNCKLQIGRLREKFNTISRASTFYHSLEELIFIRRWQLSRRLSGCREDGGGADAALDTHSGFNSTESCGAKAGCW